MSTNIDAAAVEDIPGPAARARAARIIAQLKADPEALAAYRRLTLELCEFTGSTKPAFGFAAFLLGEGEWRLGWHELARWHDLEHPGNTFRGRPRWDGTASLRGQTVLVRLGRFAGLGDIIQLMRFIPLLAEQHGCRVVLETRPTLAGLAAGHQPGVTVWQADQDPAPRFDVFMWLFAVPHALRIATGSCAGGAPYLAPDPRLVAQWGRRLAGVGDGLRVGLIWAGASWRLHRRNIPLATLAPLAGIPGVRFVALQRTTPPADQPDWQRTVAGGAEDEPSPPGLDMLRLGPELRTFADTAAVMSLLDLVITVDTGPAHLAGAIGRPTWLLVQRRCEWRWAGTDNRTPWYRSMRVYRQHRPDDWTEPLGRVQRDLRRLAAERRSA